MEILSLLARVALAAVLATSGVAKLLDRRGTREAVEGFGVPAALVGTVAAVLPWAELGTAALLVPGATGRPGALLALLLLAAFTAAVVGALARGRRPECHCFGRIGGSDVSGRTVARNVVLGGLAVLGLAGPATGPLGLADDRSAGAAAAVVLGGVALAAAVVAVEVATGRAALRRREAEQEAAFEAELAAPSRSGPAPAFSLPGLRGGTVGLDGLLDGRRPLLLVFLSPGCGPCRALLPSVKRWAELYPDRLTVAVLTSGDEERNAPLYADTPGLPVGLDVDREVKGAYGVSGTPSAALLRPDGHWGGPVGVGASAVRRLLAAGLAGTDADLDTPLSVEGEPVEGITVDSVLGPRRTVTTHPTPDADGGVTVVDELTGATLTLDRIGAVVWQCLDGVSPLREIVADLADAFGAPTDRVTEDVLRLARDVGRMGMLEGYAAAPPDDEVVHEHHDHHQHVAHARHAGPDHRGPGDAGAALTAR